MFVLTVLGSVAGSGALKGCSSLLKQYHARHLHRHYTYSPHTQETDKRKPLCLTVVFEDEENGGQLFWNLLMRSSLHKEACKTVRVHTRTRLVMWSQRIVWGGLSWRLKYVVLCARTFACMLACLIGAASIVELIITHGDAPLSIQIICRVWRDMFKVDVMLVEK